jgi:hypothetical protein
MDLSTLTSGTPTTKPWMNLVANSVSTHTLQADIFTIVDLNVSGNLEVKGNEYVNGYSSSKSEAAGVTILSLTNGLSTMPAGTGGASITYDSKHDAVVVSGLSGANTSAYTEDGAVTWTQPTVPSAVPCTDFSPQLGYYCLIDGSGNSVWTSPTYHTGTFTARAAYAGTFNGLIKWFPNIQNGIFVATAINPSSTIAISPDGINFTSVSSTRNVEDFAYSPDLGVFVTGGVDGFMYSKDGLVINSPQTFQINAVCWSSYWGMFVAAPRSVNLTSIYTSVDGITWVQTPNIFPVSFPGFNDITWSQDQMVFVGVGDSENVWVSQDGFSWKKLAPTNPGANSWYGVEYVPSWGQWYMVGIQAVARVTPKRFDQSLF